jgi:hypothetical protein
MQTVLSVYAAYDVYLAYAAWPDVFVVHAGLCAYYQP